MHDIIHKHFLVSTVQKCIVLANQRRSCQLYQRYFIGLLILSDILFVLVQNTQTDATEDNVV
jgi:hypothetical protein